MNKPTLKLYTTVQAFKEEYGQDLIEYVLIGGIVALGAIAGMNTLASNLNVAFGNLSTTVTNYAHS